MSPRHAPKCQAIGFDIIAKRDEVEALRRAGQDFTRQASELVGFKAEVRAAFADAVANPDKDPAPRGTPAAAPRGGSR